MKTKIEFEMKDFNIYNHIGIKKPVILATGLSIDKINSFLQLLWALFCSQQAD